MLCVKLQGQSQYLRKKLGCDVVITSDCHDADNLGFAYDKAIELVKECGFEKVKVLTKNGFEDRRV